VTQRDLLMFAAGGLFFFTLLLSCDGSTSDSDAASCDCPVAEPPLLGRTQEFEASTTIPPANMGPAFGKKGGFVSCPDGSLLLSGGCASAVGTVPDIVIEGSFPGGGGWSCSWKNLSNEPVQVRSIARCLMPAP
jgi:hypothetical protein